MEFRTVGGAGIAPYLEDVARLRIAVFREWPYLYDGSAEYEARYLQDYVDCPDNSTLVLALEGDRVVGPPLRCRWPRPRRSSRPRSLSSAWAWQRITTWRNRCWSRAPSGAGHRFFDEREAAARRLVVRPEDHPRRPVRYRPLDGFWNKRGYRCAEGLVCRFPWPDIGETQESLKPLQFWWRRLSHKAGIQPGFGLRF